MSRQLLNISKDGEAPFISSGWLVWAESPRERAVSSHTSGAGDICWGPLSARAFSSSKYLCSLGIHEAVNAYFDLALMNAYLTTVLGGSVQNNIGLVLHGVMEYDLSLRFLENALAISSKYHGSKSLKVALR